MKHVFVIDDHLLKAMPEKMVGTLEATAQTFFTVSSDPDDPNANLKKNRYGRNGLIRKDQIVDAITQDVFTPDQT